MGTRKSAKKIKTLSSAFFAKNANTRPFCAIATMKQKQKTAPNKTTMLSLTSKSVESKNLNLSDKSASRMSWSTNRSPLCTSVTLSKLDCARKSTSWQVTSRRTNYSKKSGSSWKTRMWSAMRRKKWWTQSKPSTRTRLTCSRSESRPRGLNDASPSKLNKKPWDACGTT